NVRRSRAAPAILMALLAGSASRSCFARGGTGTGAPRPPWTSATTFFVVSLAALSLMAVIALIPYTAEYWSPSRTMEEHRRRLKGLGAPGRLTEWFLPHFVDGYPPQQFWGWMLYGCWVG